MIEKEIQSNYLQETITLKMYLPEKIDPLYKNTVCVMQDGNDYFQIGKIATLSDRLHDEEDIANTTFVGIHYIDRFDRVKKYHPKGEKFEAYLQFLSKEVVPTLDEFLPLNPLGIQRALMGDSLAATIALMTAVRYPELFETIILQSPLIDDAVLNEVKNGKDIHSLHIYHTIGQDETNVQTTLDDAVDFLTPNRALYYLLRKRNSNYTYQEFKHADHTWKYWQKDLPHAIKEMLQ